MKRFAVLTLGAGGLVCLTLAGGIHPPPAEGATNIEYGLIAAGISVAIISAVHEVGTQVGDTFSTVSDSLNSGFELGVAGSDLDGSGENLVALHMTLCGSPSIGPGCAPIVPTGTRTFEGVTHEGDLVTSECQYILGPASGVYGDPVEFTFTVVEATETEIVVEATDDVTLGVFLWDADTIYGPRISDLTLSGLGGVATLTALIDWQLTSAVTLDDYSPEGWDACHPGIGTISADAVGTGTGSFETTEAVQYVAIDLKPGDDDNTLNLGANGAVPLAVLSTEGFDAPAWVDPATAVLEGASVKVVGKSNRLLATATDVDGDGDDDLLLKMDGSALETTTGDLVVFEAQTYPLEELGFERITLVAGAPIRVVP